MDDAGERLSRHLVGLCRRCHSRTNGNKDFWMSFFVKRLSDKYGYVYTDMNARGDVTS